MSEATQRAAGTQFPGIRRIDKGDILEALDRGLRDFRTAPRYGIAIGGVFAVAGWLLIALLWQFGLPYLAYPLAMGFAIIAPFAALGLYAVSDLLERGEEPSWSKVLGAIRNGLKRDSRWMAFVTGFALVLWMDIAAFIFFAFMGFESFDARIVEKLFTTPTGIAFLILGHGIGAILAAIVFSISAVSFPMLYHRDIDFVTAMLTSVRLVAANPGPMLIWALIIGVDLLISIATGFLGLIVLLPVIGHATWHLYRRAIDPDEVVAHAQRSAVASTPSP